MLEFKATPSFRDLQGRFAKANADLLVSRLELMRELGRRMADLSQDEAPEKTGAFKRTIGAYTFVEGQAIGFRIRMAQPLGSFILEGTHAHIISARNAMALRFEVGGRIVFAKSVQHPGTKPNRFTSRAYRQWLPEARTGLRRISLHYQQTLTARGSSGQT